MQGQGIVTQLPTTRHRIATEAWIPKSHVKGEEELNVATRTREWHVTLVLDLDRGISTPDFERLSTLWGNRAHVARGNNESENAPRLASNHHRIRRVGDGRGGPCRR